jgi:hypothetical protein
MSGRIEQRQAGQYRSVRKVRAGQPVTDDRDATLFGGLSQTEIEEAQAPETSMQMLGYLLIALAVTALAVAVGLVIATTGAAR